MPPASTGTRALRRALPLCLAFLSLPAEGGAFGLPRLTADDVREESAALPVSKATAAEWTVMVFLNAKNNLEEFGLLDLNEMETAGSSDKVNIVAELGRIKGYDAADGDWTGARRYLVVKDQDMGRIASPVLADLGPADLGDYRHIIDFVRWAKARYPAKKYMLVIWNHGSGWTKAAAGGQRGISYDDQSGSHVDIPQLGAILRETGGADVYASDACLMQMAEVAWELKDHASYVVGSEETEPSDGYPYDSLLAGLTANPQMTPAALAALTVATYGAYYTAQGTGATMSAIKTSALPGFAGLSDAFTAAAIAAGDKGVVKRGLYYAQHYSYEDNKDLDSFVSYVVLRSNDLRVRETGTELLSYLRAELIAHKAASAETHPIPGLPSPDYPQAGGLAVYLPGAPAASGYADLKWAQDSAWDDFLAWIAKPK